ncbi:site-specific integrase [Paraburkholderia terrae]|uniref:tyrosine-type recombinase/integrase n=1 Tax=Paraburkholderia terrae TaxID=311230 RepID=UPI001EE16A7E|nr:site-specific integrase [Paraburkholderia terrae]GJH02262.1 site-specific integrase [Paraburkholderia terrae]
MALSTVTVKELEKLTPADKGKRIAEGKGFFGKVLVSKAGAVSVSFYLHYRWGAKTQDYGCGSWPDTPLSVIRKNADAARVLLNDGKNPVEVRAIERDAKKQAEVEAAKQALTLRRLFEQYRDAELVHTRKDKGAGPQRALEIDVFPTLGDRPAFEVKQSELLAVLDAIKARGRLATANKALGYLSSVFEWGMKREKVPANPLVGITRGDVGGADGEGDRVLSETEIHRLSTLVANAGLTDRTRHALWVLLGTAARTNELLRARRADFDVVQRVWTIPKAHSKNTKPHTVYLSDFVLPHVEALLALSAGSSWLMPHRDDTDQHAHAQALVNQTADRQLAFYKRKSENVIQHAHALELGDSRWTPHDLRRTAATHMGELGISPDVIDKVLNHKERSKVRRTYQRAVKFDQQCHAWRVWGARLHVLTSAANVVPLEASKQA